MAAIVAAIVVSTVAGVWAERRYGAGATTASRRLLLATLYFVLPPVTFLNLVDADLSGDAGLGILFGLVSLSLLGLVAWFVATRVLHLSAGHGRSGDLVGDRRQHRLSRLRRGRGAIRLRRPRRGRRLRHPRLRARRC